MMLASASCWFGRVSNSPDSNMYTRCARPSIIGSDRVQVDVNSNLKEQRLGDSSILVQAIPMRRGKPNGHKPDYQSCALDSLLLNYIDMMLTRHCSAALRACVSVERGPALFAAPLVAAQLLHGLALLAAACQRLDGVDNAALTWLPTSCTPHDTIRECFSQIE